MKTNVKTGIVMIIKTGEGKRMMFDDDSTKAATHGFSAILGGVAWAVMRFLLGWKKSTSDDLRAVITALTEQGDKRELRLATLEAHVEALSQDHAQCLAKTARLETQLEWLTKQAEREETKN